MSHLMTLGWASLWKTNRIAMGNVLRLGSLLKSLVTGLLVSNGIFRAISESDIQITGIDRGHHVDFREF